MISKAPIDSEISHEKYATIINEEYKYCRSDYKKALE